MAHRDHNFGVTKHSGGRIILQMDFPARQIRVLDRGVVKKCCSFRDINKELTFFPQNGLEFNISIPNKEMLLKADSLEEKHTIFGLIQLAWEPSVTEAVTGKIPCRRIRSLDENQHVIKEGYLEKKGNAAIVFWEKRLVKLMAGYFAYYKPKKKNALHIVNTSEQTKIVREEDYCFRIKVKDRMYWFRLINNHGTMSDKAMEEEIQDWMSAFSWACRGNRLTIREHCPRPKIDENYSPDNLSSPLSLSVDQISDGKPSSHSKIDTDFVRTKESKYKYSDEKVNHDKMNSSPELDIGGPPLPVKKNSLDESDEEEDSSARKRIVTGRYDYPADYLYRVEMIKIADISLDQRDKSHSTKRDPSVHISAIEPTEVLDNNSLKTRPKPVSLNKDRKPMKIQENETTCDSEEDSDSSISETGQYSVTREVEEDNELDAESETEETEFDTGSEIIETHM